jgi:hypothetical protein
VIRTVVAQLWSGPVIIRRLRLSAADQAAHVDLMDDTAIAANLRRLGVARIPDTLEQQRARLKTWPTPADLDAIATAWTSRNQGVRPTVRVLEHARRPRVSGPAGSMPA